MLAETCTVLFTYLYIKLLELYGIANHLNLIRIYDPAELGSYWCDETCNEATLSFFCGRGEENPDK
jgi:hypothetical protein